MAIIESTEVGGAKVEVYIPNPANAAMARSKKGSLEITVGDLVVTLWAEEHELVSLARMLNSALMPDLGDDADKAYDSTK